MVFMLVLLALVLYVVFWALDRRANPGSGGSGAVRRPPAPRGPDDDEDFLA